MVEEHNTGCHKAITAFSLRNIVLSSQEKQPQDRQTLLLLCTLPKSRETMLTAPVTKEVSTSAKIIWLSC